MNFMLFIIKFIKFKPIIKFKKLELDNYAIQYDKKIKLQLYNGN